MAQKRGESAMGGKKNKTKEGGKKPHKLHVRHAAGGGYIAEHHFKGGANGEAPPEMEEHAVPDIAALQEHVGQHMAPEAGAEAAAAPAAPPAGGAMPGM